MFAFFFSSRRRHTRLTCDWSSDVCSSDLEPTIAEQGANAVVDRIAKLARASIGAARGKEIAGVGIGSPGPLNKIGRASCRERVENSVVDETTKIEGLDM